MASPEGVKSLEEAFIEQYDHLMMVIKEVHKDHADDLCWLSIDKIFKAAGLSVPDRRVGDKSAMLKNCHRYIDVMCDGGGWPSYAELEAKVERLERELRERGS